ncbi:hypothetical protein Trydic_g17247 [Trypoxylus dichotomus]
MFSDKGPDLIDNYPSNKKHLREYILRDPVHQGTQFSVQQAEHQLNTMRAEYVNNSMCHVEGGWPKDINTADEEQTKRYRRKIEKDEGFTHTMMQLCRNMENCILQNNAINIYQQYYTDVEPTPLIDKSSARTVNVYQDQYPVTRPVTHISWSPDGGTKLAVSHCNLVFQSIVQNESKHSFIWEVENPNVPLIVLKPPTASVCLEYNQKDTNSLVSGQLNGQVAVWDIRRGSEPVELSVVEQSHRDPVHNVLWINSKSGSEFFSSSTDGQVKWWDVRKLSEPLETLILDPSKNEDQVISNAMGVSCLEYESTIPTRFMVGTEHGIVVSCNRKGKTPQEKMVSRFSCHLGPVLALQRNPSYLKNFLTIGDWTAKIWSEDCKESCIMWTNFHKARLTDGAWSPTRYSVFFTTRSDGILDVWDILQQQKQASVGVKVCDESLKTLRTHDLGRLVAVGNKKGTTYLVEFSENLASSNKNDKSLLTAMFERETRREKILEARNRELRLKHRVRSGTALDEQKEKEPSEVVFADSYVISAETEFFQIIKEATKSTAEEEEHHLGPEPEPDFESESEHEPELEPEPEPPKPPEPKPKDVKKKKK